ncbi:MAG: TIGR04282 family arsenosugar biosynthesis glycosyltransferase [Alphaproteobacteria bacterium]|nr:TIGR04282 family arsenosugar biosynthesis glycosyltransferase [Alphaproteobacteria bacterium]HJP22518.1 TIGR04282 family arsenosugar biosynthesis glycosyltransferase [Alphaproteobacteria bacterium]
MNGPQPHLVVFAKAPRLGAVKSRLARQVGAVAAWRFYRNSLAQTLRRLDDRRWRTWLCLTPDTFAPGPLWSGDRLAQGGGDLGARMARPFVNLPPGPVVLVGCDIPALERRHVSTAFAALGRHQAVFGPARDGGFWLVGLRRRPAPPRHRPGLFTAVRWSGPQTLAETLEGFHNQPAALLEILADVDNAADLERRES